MPKPWSTLPPADAPTPVSTTGSLHRLLTAIAALPGLLHEVGTLCACRPAKVSAGLSCAGWDPTMCIAVYCRRVTLQLLHGARLEGSALLYGLVQLAAGMPIDVSGSVACLLSDCLLHSSSNSRLVDSAATR
jgi:hypothetical protein